jgi:hypothetical protein
MRAIKIDAINQEVKEIDFEGNFQDIQREIDVDCFTVVPMDNGDALYVDDEGLLNGTFMFMEIEIDGYVRFLAGNGLILGTDDEGESSDALSEIPNVSFLNRFELKARMADLDEKQVVYY